MPRRFEQLPSNPDPDPVVNDAIGLFMRLSPSEQAGVVVLLLVAIGVIAWICLRQQTNPAVQARAVGSPQMLLGNPSNAGTDANNYLMVKPYFALSYDNATGEPNWVSWRLIQSDLGTAPRAPEFLPDDDTLPAGFRRIVSRDYAGGGFDRGHMCPHSDRAADQTSSYATFVMSNIIPQAPNVNRKAWDQMENYCRELVRSHRRLYITAGPAGRGGTGSRGFRQTIADGKVVVPSDCWKIVVILPDDGVDPDPATISPATRVLAVDMPNDQSTVGEEWAQYRTSPAVIEQKTGLHFFDQLRPDVAATLRMRIDTAPLPEPRSHGHVAD
jgi:endonuclease G